MPGAAARQAGAHPPMRRLWLLVLCLVAPLRVEGGNCAREPVDIADFFTANTVKDLNSPDESALRDLLALAPSNNFALSMAADSSKTSLCCASNKDTNTWEVTAITSDEATCASYSQSAPCTMRDGSSQIFRASDTDFGSGSCTGEIGKVEKIKLRSQRLTGGLPSSIGSFPDLRELDIGGDNFLTGVHANLGNLDALQLFKADGALTQAASAGSTNTHDVLALLMDIKGGGADSKLTTINLASNYLTGATAGAVNELLGGRGRRMGG